MRDERQREAVNSYLSHQDRRSIIYACPRFGKIKVAIDIMEKMNVNNVWILAPRNDIFTGWDDDMKKFNSSVKMIGQTTFASIKKLWNKFPDLIIIDEPHEMSVNQQYTLANKLKEYKGPILGLTGTMTQKTREELYNNLNLDVCYKYSIAEGVEDGILVDYQINIHKIPLDNTRYNYSTKNKKYTERGFFNLQEYLKKEAKSSRSKHMFNLKMINIIQNSVAKMEMTRKLINETNDRVLVFCGVTEVADKLGIPVYHSKKKEEEVFTSFCKNLGINQLATIKMMQAGVTINPINRGIINYTSGNPEDSAQKICRFLGMEYTNLNKVADIHIVVTTEEFELTRLHTSLLFFDKEKIKICV